MISITATSKIAQVKEDDLFAEKDVFVRDEVYACISRADETCISRNQRFNFWGNLVELGDFRPKVLAKGVQA